MRVEPCLFLLVAVLASMLPAGFSGAALRAGAAKVDISHPTALASHDPLYAKALVLDDGRTTAAIITLDVVAIAEIGPIKGNYLATVRGELEKQLRIPPRQVLVNVSHCHGVVCADVAARTVQAVREAYQRLTPVRAGAGTGHEDRIMENRRLKLKSGKTVDVRHAYSLPPDEEVAAVGPVDPRIGIVRLDRLDGRPLAVVYHFACHPIQGVPDGGNTADVSGFASRVLEESLGEGAVALFLQGCGGDINPAGYKDFHHPRSAEPLGNRLGLSTLSGLRRIQTREDADLRIRNESIEVPRADWSKRIAKLQSEQERLVASLRGTTLNLKAFLELSAKYGLAGEFPSADAPRYLQEHQLGKEELARWDALNRKNLQQYRQNVYVMEELTRVQTNLALLKRRQAQNQAAGMKPLEVEVVGLRVGNFRLVTFPGELSVEIGLDIQRRFPDPLSFVSGYSNGYIYYAPTAEQLRNPGAAQEDCDCWLAPEWQEQFEKKAVEVLRAL